MFRPARLALAACSLVFLTAVRAQTAGSAASANPAAAPAIPPLALSDAVAQALQKNFAVNIQRFPVDQARDLVIINQANFYPTFNLTSEKTVLKDVGEQVQVVEGNSLTTIPAYSNDQTTTASIADNLLTGGTVSANYSLERQFTNSGIDLLNPSYLGDVSITVSQPLLQGAGTDYSRAAIDRAKLGVRIAKLNLKSAVLTVVFNTETAYFNLLFAREQYKVGQDTLQLAQALLDENTIKRKTGVLTDLDVLQAQVGVATARSQLIIFEQTVQNSEDALLQDLGERQFKNGVGAVDFPPIGDTDVSFDYSYKLARDNGPSLAIVDTMIEQFKLDALKARRDELPVLSVNGGLGYNSYQNDYYEAANRLWNGSGYNWQAGVTVSVPWGMAQNRALYRQAMANVHSEELTSQQTDQQLTVQVRSAIRAVQTNVESVRAASEEATLSQKQYELQKAELDAGLATSFDVLQAQNQLEAARVSELQAKVNLRDAIADLRFLEGSSIDGYHIDLK
jgi:outer membrane protein TolC